MSKKKNAFHAQLATDLSKKKLLVISIMAWTLINFSLTPSSCSIKINLKKLKLF